MEHPHQHHPLYAAEYPHINTSVPADTSDPSDPQPPQLSSDAIVLVLFLLGCVFLGLGIKLVLVMLRRWRWVENIIYYSSAILHFYFRKQNEVEKFERKYSTVT